MIRCGRRWTLILGLGSLVSATAALAQPFPTKPVRIMTGNAGAIGDVIARQVARRLSERWQQPVVVENKATIIISAAAAAKASADGYTIMLGDRTSHAVAPAVMIELPYQPVGDFAPITLVARAPMLLVAHPSVPASNLRELIAYARQRPGVLNYAAAGPGSAAHITAERFKQVAGVDLANVQYKGGGAAAAAILSGEAQAGFVLTPVALPHIRSGKLKAYAITSSTRFSGAPDVATMAEAGLPALDSEQLWLALFAPARTGAALIAKLNQDIVEVLKMPALAEAVRATVAETASSTPEELARFLQSETAMLRKVVQIAGIRAD